MAKLMVSIRDENFRLLSLEARERGITIQELIRAVIVPDWVRFTNIAGIQRQKISPEFATMGIKEDVVPPILTGRRP